MTGNTQATTKRPNQTGEPQPFDPRDDALSEFQALSFAGFAILTASMAVGLSMWRSRYLELVQETVDAGNRLIDDLEATLA